VTVVLTQAQRDDAVRLVEDGYSTAAVARLMNCSRRNIQNIVKAAGEASEEEVRGARAA
jgi:DNA-binding CsgD family transcriptional regulator